MARDNVIAHVEWRTKDADRLKHFYGQIFDWKFTDPMPGYTMVDTGSKEGGAGIFHIPPDQAIPPGVVNYVSVTDIDTAENRIRDAGGQILMSRQEVPGIGWFTVFTDVENNPMAIWQQTAAPKTARRKPAKKKAKAKAKAKAKKKTTKKKGRR